VEPSAFDEMAFFQAIHESGARALLIGRRTLVLLGLPVLTSDYDYWIATDDIARFNSACEAFDLVPNRTPDDARRTDRYVLENDEHIDVLVARSVRTVDGHLVEFESLWNRRQSVDLENGVQVIVPTIDDLILTKQIDPRPKDIEDVRLLQALKRDEER
jgi:hypothetical protein